MRIFNHVFQTQPGPGQYEPGELTRPGSKKPPGFLSTAQRNDKLSQKFFTRNFVSYLSYFIFFMFCVHTFSCSVGPGCQIFYHYCLQNIILVFVVV